MTDSLTVTGTLAYDVTGDGPLVVLAHGIGDSRHAYRFVAPALSPPATASPPSTSAAAATPASGGTATPAPTSPGDLVALVATSAEDRPSSGSRSAAGPHRRRRDAPDRVAGVVELAPFTPRVAYLGGCCG